MFVFGKKVHNLHKSTLYSMQRKVTVVQMFYFVKIVHILVQQTETYMSEFPVERSALIFDLFPLFFPILEDLFY